MTIIMDSSCKISYDLKFAYSTNTKPQCVTLLEFAALLLLK